MVGTLDLQTAVLGMLFLDRYVGTSQGARLHEFVKCALARKVVKVFVSCVELQKHVQKYKVVIL